MTLINTLESLMHGQCPVTDRPLPEDSPLHRPEVIRALADLASLAICARHEEMQRHQSATIPDVGC